MSNMSDSVPQTCLILQRNNISIGTIQRKKPVSKDTNPETFWNIFDKIISITKLKLENPKWGPVKMANMVHT
jgi:hypothetical protein